MNEAFESQYCWSGVQSNDTCRRSISSPRGKRCAAASGAERSHMYEPVVDLLDITHGEEVVSPVEFREYSRSSKGIRRERQWCVLRESSQNREWELHI